MRRVGLRARESVAHSMYMPPTDPCDTLSTMPCRHEHMVCLQLLTDAAKCF